MGAAILDLTLWGPPSWIGRRGGRHLGPEVTSKTLNRHLYYCPLYISRLSGCNFHKNKNKNKVYFFIDDRFIFTRSIEPNECKLHFHLGFYCLYKYSFRDFPNTKCNKNIKY